MEEKSVLVRAWSFVWRASLNGCIGWIVKKLLDKSVAYIPPGMGKVISSFLAIPSAWFVGAGIFSGLIWAAWPEIAKRATRRKIEKEQASIDPNDGNLPYLIVHEIKIKTGDCYEADTLYETIDPHKRVWGQYLKIHGTLENIGHGIASSISMEIEYEGCKPDPDRTVVITNPLAEGKTIDLSDYRFSILLPNGVAVYGSVPGLLFDARDWKLKISYKTPLNAARVSVYENSQETNWMPKFSIEDE